MDVLIQKVIEWGNEKEIFLKSTPYKQLLKSASELGEVCDAMAKQDYVHAKMEIGDFIVTLILFCEMIGERYYIVHNINGELSRSIERIHTRLFHIYLKPYSNNIWLEEMSNEVSKLCFFIGTTQEECLQMAYEKISKRTGKMENGVFVKDGL